MSALPSRRCCRPRTAGSTAAVRSGRQEATLTPSEVERGVGIIECMFDADEMTRLADTLSRSPVNRSKAGARHVLGVPAVNRLAADARLTGIASAFVGPSPLPFRATLFDKSLAANWLVVWHQDTALPVRQRVESPEWGPWSVKSGVLYAHAPASALNEVVAVRVHLDDCTADNGPLRVLPGTHSLGVLTDADIDRLSRDGVPVDCLAGAGGVVAMRPLTVHSSSKARNNRPRRVLHIEYARTLCLADGIQLAVG